MHQLIPFFQHRSDRLCFLRRSSRRWRYQVTRVRLELLFACEKATHESTSLAEVKAVGALGLGEGCRSARQRRIPCAGNFCYLVPYFSSRHNFAFLFTIILFLFFVCN